MSLELIILKSYYIRCSIARRVSMEFHIFFWVGEAFNFPLFTLYPSPNIFLNTFLSYLSLRILFVCLFFFSPTYILKRSTNLNLSKTVFTIITRRWGWGRIGQSTMLKWRWHRCAPQDQKGRNIMGRGELLGLCLWRILPKVQWCICGRFANIYSDSFRDIYAGEHL